VGYHKATLLRFFLPIQSLMKVPRIDIIASNVITAVLVATRLPDGKRRLIFNCDFLPFHSMVKLGYVCLVSM
jgi:hypothetical protein